MFSLKASKYISKFGFHICNHSSIFSIHPSVFFFLLFTHLSIHAFKHFFNKTKTHLIWPI